MNNRMESEAGYPAPLQGTIEEGPAPLPPVPAALKREGANERSHGLSRKPLRIITPEAYGRSVDVDLSGDAVLTLEERRERDIALNALAAQRRMPIPNDEAVL